MNPVLIEALGYTASLIILISLLMKSIVKLRWINAAGSLLFVIFAVLTRSLPTVAMNLGIICIDIFYVVRLTAGKNEYRLIRAERTSSFLDFFYRAHSDEISSIFGEDAFAESHGFSYFVCNTEIAGLFSWRENSPTECRVMIDFVTPRYRDTKIGRYFFDQHLASFREKGFDRLVCLCADGRHAKYLARIGFVEETPGRFAKNITL